LWSPTGWCGSWAGSDISPGKPRDNHLDVENLEVLEDALDDYEGSVLLVSHDRAFLREVATRVWSFDATHLTDFGGPFVGREEDRARRGVTS
jgi:ATP-binding cassette subfamily F protein 3